MRNFDIIVLFIITQLCLTAEAAQSSSLPADDQGQLIALETRFFGYSNAQHDLSSRLDKLEGLVFGKSFATDSQQKRITRLANAISNAGKLAQALGSSRAPKAEAQSSSPTDVRSAPIGASYPKITTIEHMLLGATHENDPVDVRLARLETKQFGTPSTCADLCTRTDTLMSRACMDEDQFFQANSGTSTDDVIDHLIAFHLSPDSQLTREDSGYAACSWGDKLTYLEQRTFGRTNAVLPITKRLQLLEDHLFGVANNNDGLLERLSKLAALLNCERPDALQRRRSLSIEPNDPIAHDPLGYLSRAKGAAARVSSLDQTLPEASLDLQSDRPGTAAGAYASGTTPKQSLWKKVGKTMLTAGELAADALGIADVGQTYTGGYGTGGMWPSFYSNAGASSLDPLGADAGSALPGASNPKITALESRLLGDTHDNEPVEARLARLKAKQYDAPSAGSDLFFSRTDQSMSRAHMEEELLLQSNIGTSADEVTDHLMASHPSPDSQTEPDNSAYSADSLGDNLSHLEQQTFGKTNAVLPITKRLQLLEEQLIGVANNDEGLLERVSTLATLFNYSHPDGPHLSRSLSLVENKPVTLDQLGYLSDPPVGAASASSLDPNLSQAYTSSANGNIHSGIR